MESSIIVNIQGDQPFLDPTMIEEAVKPLLEDPAVELCTLKHAIRDAEDLADPAVVALTVGQGGNYQEYCTGTLVGRLA